MGSQQNIDQLTLHGPSSRIRTSDLWIQHLQFNIINSTSSYIRFVIYSCLFSYSIGNGRVRSCDLPALRKQRSRFQSAATRMKNKLQALIHENDPSKLDMDGLSEKLTSIELTQTKGNTVFESLLEQEEDEELLRADEDYKDTFVDSICLVKKMCKRLMAANEAWMLEAWLSTKLSSLETEMTRDPTKDHTRTVDSIRTTMKKLDAILLASTIPADDRLRSIASQMGDRLMLLDAKEKEPSVSFSAHSEYPPVIKTAQEAYKRALIEIPHFSGEVEDWQTFWVQFKEAVHDSKKLTNGAKLVYLRQAMDDQSLKRLLSDNVGGEDFYENMVTVLQKRFDRPREIHVIHCWTLADLQPTNQAEGAEETGRHLVFSCKWHRQAGTE